MSFFGMGPMEILVIVLIAFIIFGPEKMTEIMGGLGRAVREFRALTSDLTGEFERTMSEVRETAEELQSSAREALTVEGLNPFEQPISPAAITANDAIASGSTTGDAPTVVPAAMRPTRSQGPAPSKADPLADFAVFGEPAPVLPPIPEPVPAPEPVAEVEILAPQEATDSFEGAVASNGHNAAEAIPDAVVTSGMLVEQTAGASSAAGDAEARTAELTTGEADSSATKPATEEAESKTAHAV